MKTELTSYDVETLARKHGVWTNDLHGKTDLARFAHELIILSAAKEREACVQIVEREASQYTNPVWSVEIINDIFERGQE